MAADTLTDAASRVDIIDAAGRIMAHPRRHAPAATTAEIYAIAAGFEACWEIVLEAQLLVRAVAMPRGRTNLDELRDLAIEAQAARVAAMLGAIGLNPEPTKET